MACNLQFFPSPPGGGMDLYSSQGPSKYGFPTSFGLLQLLIGLEGAKWIQSSSL